MENNDLLVMFGQNYKDMTKSLMKMGRVSERIGDRGMLIGIKPNLLGPIPADEGATTHPEVVAGIIEYLREEGFERIVVLESSWVGDRTADALLVTGFDRLLEQYNVPFWDLQEDRGVEMVKDDISLTVCERVTRIDFLINVPVLKGHCQTKMTCALKNMKGLLPASEKRRFHRMGLHEPIGQLSGIVRQDLILVDSICGDLTFEDGGHPVQQDRLILAADPVLCDTYACSLLGLDPEEVAYIGSAARHGCGSSDLARAHIVRFREDGMPMEDAQEPVPMQNDYRDIMRIFDAAQQVDTCSACYASLLPGLLALDRAGKLQDLPGKICIGQGYKGKNGDYGVGSCTKNFAHHLPGCPPSPEAVQTFLEALVLNGR